MSNDSRFIHKRITALVSANPCIKLQELAISLNIERHKIEGVLKEQYGYGFREFKKRVRLNHVIGLITKDNPRISIKEIAATIGIIPNNLHRFIRSMTGCCVRELRDNKMSTSGYSLIRRSLKHQNKIFQK
jgi:AraC-like DNA-binding protein